MTSDNNHEPLHDREAERAVLGAMLMDTDVIPRVMPILGESPAAFFTTDHQIIYSVAVDIYSQHQKADILLVADQLKKTNQLKRVGGAIYLYDLQARIVETENTEFHAQIVRDNWMRRQLVQAGANIRAIAHDGEKDLVHVLDEAQQTVFKLTDSGVRNPPQPHHALINAELKAIEERHNNPGIYAGVPTGFIDFDLATNGLQPGNFVVIAGRPGLGKTSFVLDIARNICLDQEQSVAIFSLEMTKSEISTRLLSAASRIDYQDLRAGRIKDSQWKHITTAAKDLMTPTSIVIADDRTLTLGGLKIKARHLKSQFDLALIIVDYVQLLHTDRDYQNREREVADISRELKSLAGELDIPVIGCSQLNRESEKKNSKPSLANLRDSGALEQDADIAAFLHADPDLSDSSPTTRELLILKNRNGKTADIELKFYPESMTFANIGIPDTEDDESPF